MTGLRIFNKIVKIAEYKKADRGIRMNLFDKLNSNMDYNNSYNLRRAISILEDEFKRAIKNNDKNYAIEILNTTQKIHDALHLGFRDSEDYGNTMSYSQKVWSNRTRKFIGYLANRLKNWS